MLTQSFAGAVAEAEKIITDAEYAGLTAGQVDERFGYLSGYA